MELIHEKELIEPRLEKMIYGAIEIRTKDAKQYIYVHYGESGIKRSKYAGECSTVLYNVILENNVLSKQYKKRLKEIIRELDLIHYQTSELDNEALINIALARRNMVASIYKKALLEGVATTYSDTETIVNSGKVMNMTASDVMKVVDLKELGSLFYRMEFFHIPQIMLSYVRSIRLLKLAFHLLQEESEAYPYRLVVQHIFRLC